MTPKFILLSLMIALTGSFATAQENNSNDPRHEPPSYRVWQCSAHGHYGNLYYGAQSTSRHQAKDSALHECEHNEGNHCRLHECYLTSGY